VLPDPTLSRRHVRLRRSGSGVTVEDLGARNGVRVGRWRVRRRRLRPGDELRLGATVLLLVGERPVRAEPRRGPRRIRWPGRLAAAAAILGGAALALVAAAALGGR
jgi:pSer/pThr/pTyr-binding forkhead associated (FHA) protein